MIDGIHRHTAHVRTPPTPTRPPGFAAGHIHMIDISQLTNRCEALFVNAANFSGGHFHQRITAFEVAQRCLSSGAARTLSDSSRPHLDGVHVYAEPSPAQRRPVP